jgi:hypothetical protein
VARGLLSASFSAEFSPRDWKQKWLAPRELKPIGCYLEASETGRYVGQARSWYHVTPVDLQPRTYAHPKNRDQRSSRGALEISPQNMVGNSTGRSSSIRTRRTSSNDVFLYRKTTSNDMSIDNGTNDTDDSYRSCQQSHSMMLRALVSLSASRIAKTCPADSYRTSRARPPENLSPFPEEDPCPAQPSPPRFAVYIIRIALFPTASSLANAAHGTLLPPPSALSLCSLTLPSHSALSLCLYIRDFLHDHIKKNLLPKRQFLLLSLPTVTKT